MSECDTYKKFVSGCIRHSACSIDPLLTIITLESMSVHVNALLAQRADTFTRKLHFESLRSRALVARIF